MVLDIINTLRQPWDLTTKKLSVSVLTKMVYCWAGTKAVLETPIPTDNSELATEGILLGPKARDLLWRRPIPGFDNFVFEGIVPAVFEFPIQNDFVIKDGQSILVINEIAHLQFTLSVVYDTQYFEFLANRYLPAANCPPELISEFVTSLQKYDQKQLKKTIKVICYLFSHSTRKSKISIKKMQCYNIM
jgi:exportin-T